MQDHRQKKGLFSPVSKIFNSVYFRKLLFRFKKLLNFRVRLNFNFRIFFYGIIVLLGIGVLYTIGNFYFNIRPTVLTINDHSSVDRPIGEIGEEVNVALLGFDDTKGEYDFLDFVTIVNFKFRDNKANIVSFDPDVSISLQDGSSVPLKSYMNLESVSSENRMSYVMDRLEDLSGIRVDRYIAFKFSSMNKFLQTYNLNTIAKLAKNSGDKFITTGTKLNFSESYNYYFSNTDKDESAISNFINFTLDFFYSAKDFQNAIRLVINPGLVNNTFFTNLDRDQFLKIGSLMGSVENMSTLAIDKSYYAKKETEYKADINMMDNKISSIFNEVKIIKEQAKLEIYNATKNKAGLASKFQRRYTQFGMRVLTANNYPESETKNYLYVPKGNASQFPETIKAISRDLRGNLKIVENEYKYNYSGDLILVLGD